MQDGEARCGKLNIAMLGHKRIPSREGGIEVVVEELSTRMAAMGHDVTCFNRSGNHVGGKEFNMDMGAEYRGVRLRRVPTVERKGLAAVTSSFFASFYSAVGKFDVVHIHAEGPAVFCWLPKLFGKKVCVSIHGLDHLRAKWKGKIGARYIRLGEKMAVRHADEIIVLGRDVQKYFEEAYGRRTRLIPNGASRPAFALPELIQERFGLDRDSYILYLGRIVPEKGGHYLVRAFRDVDTKKKLVIAGGASDSAEYLAGLKTLAEGDGRVIFTGFVQGRVLEELYSNAYIYCLPSDLEGMPLSLLEAMGYGNCCLTSDIPECVEAVGDKAVVFRKSDVGDLREKLQWLCDNPQAAAGYKEKAPSAPCREYGWDEVAESTLGVYRGLHEGIG